MRSKNGTVVVSREWIEAIERKVDAELFAGTLFSTFIVMEELKRDLAFIQQGIGGLAGLNTETATARKKP